VSGEEDPIGSCEAGLVDLTLQDGELVTQRQIKRMLGVSPARYARSR
jgi:hypothetical protein